MALFYKVSYNISIDIISMVSQKLCRNNKTLLIVQNSHYCIKYIQDSTQESKIYAPKRQKVAKINKMNVYTVCMMPQQ